MSGAKKIFVQSMAIATAILFLNGINAVIQHFAGNDIVMQWYHPITIVLTGVLCALPTALLRDMDQWDRKTFLVRVSVHCLSLCAIVAGAGWLFRWYTDLESFVSVTVIFFIVYAFVWLSSHWLDKQDEKKINHALDTIRDEV